MPDLGRVIAYLMGGEVTAGGAEGQPGKHHQELVGPAATVSEMADPSLNYMLGRLEIVERRLRIMVHDRRVHDPDPDDPFRGLYLSGDHMESVLSTSPAVRFATSDPEEVGLLAEIEAAADAAEAEGADIRLRRLARAFALSQLDLDLLLVALAPDVDSRFELLYAYLNDDVSRRRATVGLALELGAVPAVLASARARLLEPAPLIDGGLVLVEDVDVPFLGRSLRVPDRITSHLLGDETPAPEIAAKHHVHTSYDAAPFVQDAAPTVVASRCSRCNAANSPDRLLCNRCGTPLRTGEQPVPAGAQGGLFPQTWGEHRVFGSDHSLRKRAIKIMLFGAIALLILAVTIGPLRDPFWGWTRDKLESIRLIAERRPTLVPAERATASSTRDGLQPRLAVDGFVNTYWAQGSKGVGVGETLTVHFAAETEIGEIQVATGIQDDITPFESQPRPKEIQITFHNGDEHTITQPDSTGFHLHEFSSVKVEKVQFQILSVYPADRGGQKRNATAIAEIEFYTPQ